MFKEISASRSWRTQAERYGDITHTCPNCGTKYAFDKAVCPSCRKSTKIVAPTIMNLPTPLVEALVSEQAVGDD